MTATGNYSFLDRLLHRVAFASPVIQFTAADVEAAMYGKRFRHIDVRRPIFLTSLPRAGTTLMLETLARFPATATHVYRDMPFVMAPLLWNAVSGHFRKPGALIERAHGDGVRISFDSPEAFEEVVWKAFWPRKFRADRIALWSERDELPDFSEFFASHMQRIIAVRSADDIEGRRYLSKNNGNIARIPYLKRLFPDASILVPFREPVAQAASLLHQHTRFQARPHDDPFARDYMRDIGHLEFGELHRPIDFEGIDEMRAVYRSDTLDYWLSYWVHGFTHIVAHADRVVLASYERLCRTGEPAVRRILEMLDISEAVTHSGRISDFHEPRSYDRETRGIKDVDLLNAAQALHARLLESSVI